MDSYNKYFKYKTKYLKYKSRLDNNLIGGSEPIHFISHDKEDFTCETTIYLFKADWCGHCKNFNDVWNKVADMFKEKIKFIVYDSDLHKPKITEWSNQGYPIKGYPTIFINTESKIIEYNKGRDINSFLEYINKILSVLNKN